MKNILICLLALSSMPLFAKELISKSKLKALEAKFISNLKRGGPAPLPFSEVDKEDVKEMIKIQSVSTNADKARANAEASCSLDAFFGAPYGLMTEAQVNLSRDVYEDIFDSSDQLTNTIKDRYLRTRPALRTDLGRNLIKKFVHISAKTSYPSGHTAIASTTAIVFSKIFPSKKKFFLKRAEQVGYDRVLGGVHHPSDVRAAGFVGELVAAEILQQPEFRHKVVSLCKQLNPGKHCTKI